MLLFGVVTFIALFAKAYDLTINRHEEMEERAFQQQTLSSTTSASRGSIYDRTGTVLAMSATADTVQLDPMAIQNRADELDQERAEKMVNGLARGETLPMTGQKYKDLIATTLSEILEVDIDSIYAQMERTFSQYEIVKKRVDRTVGDQIRAFIRKTRSRASTCSATPSDTTATATWPAMCWASWTTTTTGPTASRPSTTTSWRAAAA